MHYWCNIYSGFVEGVDFVYCSCIWRGLCGDCKAGLFSKRENYIMHFLCFLWWINKFQIPITSSCVSKRAPLKLLYWLNCFSRAKESFRKFAKWLQKTESCPQFSYIFSNRNPVRTLWEDAHQTPSLWLWKTEQVWRICFYQRIINLCFFSK